MRGVTKVVKEAYQDNTATEGDWSCVDLEKVKPLSTPVTLAKVKADPNLSAMALIKQSRLSVMPVTPKEYDRILELAEMN